MQGSFNTTWSLDSNFVICFQLSDVDSDTIQRQRRELQLLIGELKDRDRYSTYIQCSFIFHKLKWNTLVHCPM